MNVEQGSTYKILRTHFFKTCVVKRKIGRKKFRGRFYEKRRGKYWGLLLREKFSGLFWGETRRKKFGVFFKEKTEIKKFAGPFLRKKVGPKIPLKKTNHTHAFLQPQTYLSFLEKKTERRKSWRLFRENIFGNICRTFTRKK